MKINKIEIFKRLKPITTLFVLILLCNQVLAQVDSGIVEPLETEMTLEVWQLGDGSIDFRVDVIAEDSLGNKIEVDGAVIDVSQIVDDSAHLIAQTVTNSLGKALLNIPSTNTLTVDDEGYLKFTVSFGGNEDYLDCSGEASFKRMYMNIEIDEDEDSLKSLLITAHFLDAENIEQAVHEVELLVYVKRMFGWLQIGDIWMEDGEGYFDFPLDIPGDADGNLMIAVKLVDSDDFASAEQTLPTDWGIPVDYSIKEKPRALWSDYAPVWMIIALIIVLTGVWFNFVLAIIKVYKMSKIKE